MTTPPSSPSKLVQFFDLPTSHDTQQMKHTAMPSAGLIMPPGSPKGELSLPSRQRRPGWLHPEENNTAAQSLELENETRNRQADEAAAVLQLFLRGAFIGTVEQMPSLTEDARLQTYENFSAL